MAQTVSESSVVVEGVISAALATAMASSVTLSSTIDAHVNTVIAEDLVKLSGDEVDVTRWANSTLSRVLDAAKDTGGGPVVEEKPSASPSAELVKETASSVFNPLQQEEQLVRLLYARVQAHSQELAKGIEDLISSILVRLPRTAMELTRMSTETEDLAVRLQRIEDVVRPAVASGSESYVSELQKRKATETRLRRCSLLLEKAAHVEENMRNLQYLVAHYESMSSQREGKTDSEAVQETGKAVDRKAVTAAPLTSTASVSIPSSHTDVHRRDLDEAADIIRRTRDDIAAIAEGAADDTFGVQYRAPLMQYERFIAHVLEEECLTCLTAHQLERATRLMTTLYSIGRAEAVLMRYGEQAVTKRVASQEEKLRTCVGNDVSKGEERVAATAVARVLHACIIPDDSMFLSQELCFLSRLVRSCLRAAQSASPDHTDKAKQEQREGHGVSGPTLGRAHGKAAELLPSLASAIDENTTTSGSSHSSVEDEQWSKEVLVILSAMLRQLYHPVHACLQSLLTAEATTTNQQLVALLHAVQELKVDTDSLSTEAPPAAETLQKASPTKSAAVKAANVNDPVQTLARDVTHQARTLFASLFHEEWVLQRYAERVCAPLKVFCAQPLSALSLSLRGDGGDGAVPETGAEDETLATVLIIAMQEVLVYEPDKITCRCIHAWHSALAQMLTPSPASIEESQRVLLEQLYTYHHQLRPFLAKSQQSVEKWLSSSTIREQYPTSSCELLADLQTGLWAPLRKEMETVQAAAEAKVLRSITQPVLACISTYATLPCWGKFSESTHGAEGVPTAEPAMHPSSLYPGQAAPSAAVRHMGEMLMELPLTLETLGSTAIVTAKESGSVEKDGKGRRSNTEVESGVRMLIEEHAEVWLGIVVHDVVRIFVEKVVQPLTIGPFTTSSRLTERGAGEGVQQQQQQQRYAAALEQLATDLDYVCNILSAVNEESLEVVARVLRAVRVLSSSSMTAPFTIGEAIQELVAPPE